MNNPSQRQAGAGKEGRSKPWFGGRSDRFTDESNAGCERKTGVSDDWEVFGLSH